MQLILKSINFSVRKLLDIPAQLSDIMKIFSKGIFKVNMDVSMSDDQKNRPSDQ